MMKKFKLREFFSVEIKGETIVGPAIIEIHQDDAKVDMHKLEEVVADDKPSKKKEKAEK